MPTIYDLKPAFQRLLRPLVRACAGVGMTPNQLTWAALGLSFVTGGLVVAAPGARWPLLLLPPVLLLRMGLNAMDGMLAREHQMQSPGGALLNEISDVLSDSALYLPLALVPGMPAAPLVVVVLLAALTELTGVTATRIGMVERVCSGP